MCLFVLVGKPDTSLRSGFIVVFSHSKPETYPYVHGLADVLPDLELVGVCDRLPTPTVKERRTAGAFCKCKQQLSILNTVILTNKTYLKTNKLHRR